MLIVPLSLICFGEVFFIITGILAIVKCPVKFDFVVGQDPVLSRDNNEFLVDELSKEGEVKYLIGDKMYDLKPAEKINAKSVFVTWGHPTGGEEEFADFTVKDAKELVKVIE